ncbi:uncharacterized protein BX663DRAFT_499691 [Cokeromyces recurvatus]|uniref:uncharacterized protein n=1 Tax=Cokeromyces recurvatus TaxID=90255 RepID=UPI002220566A|nr:uncharacterized protein BX663DRAFT_499691 [Cokeromyces recurvatus]KAI7905429.1 hypothetical protein BX663DRAFT_499691 [Cokeromyces recurvatus]
MIRQIARTSIQQVARPTLFLTRTTYIPILRRRIVFCNKLDQRSFNTSSIRCMINNDNNNDKSSYSVTTLTTDRYHRLSDEILEHIISVLEDISDEVDIKGFDVEYSQGVMTLSLGEKGTYVVNKQPPNHQIWLSSPISGPQRYDYDEKYQKWFYHRDNHTLDEVLNAELSQALGRDVNVLEGFEPEEK